MTRKCVKCDEKFSFQDTDTYWDEKGSESVKLVSCKSCGCVQAIRYINSTNPNTDKRFFLNNSEVKNN